MKLKTIKILKILTCKFGLMIIKLRFEIKSFKNKEKKMKNLIVKNY